MKKIFNERLPGRVAVALLIAITTFWSYWSIGEMYHEGWWGVWYFRLFYLIPGAVCLLLTLMAIRWPKIGGWLIVFIGGAFTIFFLDIKFVDGKFTMDNGFVGFLVSGPLVIIGILFLIEASNKKHRISQGWNHYPSWWRRNLASILAVIPPLIIFIGFSFYYWPIVFTRIDDGDRGVRRIDGNGVELIWAPEGPGWNWIQDFGGYPSWNMIALYGVSPIGMGDKPGYGSEVGRHAGAQEMSDYNLCNFLSEDGLSLMSVPQSIWRMPTVDEYLRSMTRHEQNAGCHWDGEVRVQMQCETLPDKETPLWAPNLAPIYYWAAEEYNESEAYFVSFNGWVNKTFKAGGNPRHSYRCVRDP